MSKAGRDFHPNRSTNQNLETQYEKARQHAPPNAHNSSITESKDIEMI
jgi:hypothetical protein